MANNKKNLIILESPTKARTLTNYLDDSYTTIATEGHILELKTSGKYGLGVDLEKFDPDFSPIKIRAKIIKKIKTMINDADNIYLATDPDREGEAIASHVQDLIPNKKMSRIIFRELTPSVVQESLKHPLEIDKNLVESQLTRRILDRMIGFRLSSLLRKSISAPSAGRVQTFTLRLIVDREEEIKKFISETSWSWRATLNDDRDLSLVMANSVKTLAIKNEDQKNQFNTELEPIKNLKIFRISTSDFKLQPPLPYKTSTLISSAASSLGTSAKKTLYLAQGLYEGMTINGKQIGLITYLRTDSTRMSEEFIKSAKGYLTTKFGSEYVSTKKLKAPKKGKVKAQDAHEAIRITLPNLTPESLVDQLPEAHWKLYNLIYKRTMTALMTPLIGQLTRYFFTPDGATDIHNMVWWCYFGVKKLVFPGFGKLAGIDSSIILDQKLLPMWKEGDKLAVTKWNSDIKITKPPARYRDASIVKTLDHFGVGRPSTYGEILERLQLSFYVEKIEGSYQATSKGEEVVQIFRKYFSNLINEEYTSGMEKSLDEIADGLKKRIKFLDDFWNGFNKEVIDAENQLKTEKIPVYVDEKCPKCESVLQVRESRYGSFFGCSSFPKCRYIAPSKENIIPDRECPDCKKKLVKRKNIRGDFISCTGYPACKYIESGKKGESLKPKIKPIAVGRACEKCGSDLVKRISRWKKEFIACSGFPKCRFIEGAAEKKAKKSISKKKTSVKK